MRSEIFSSRKRFKAATFLVMHTGQKIKYMLTASPFPPGPGVSVTTR